MKNKLSKNQWVAVITSLGVAVFIIFFSLQNSPVLQQEGNALSSLPQFITENDSIISMNDNEKNIDELITEEISVGEGKVAENGKKILVNYAGFLTDGSQFDSSWKRGIPFKFTLGAGAVIEGWDKGVLGMKEGGVRKLIIPSNLAYGENEVGPIPPNSTLIFVVELLEVN